MTLDESPDESLRKMENFLLKLGGLYFFILVSVMAVLLFALNYTECPK